VSTLKKQKTTTKRSQINNLILYIELLEKQQQQRSQINNLIIYVEFLEKQKQSNPQTMGRKK
jgi:hypothetical protein